ncbi:hypothetical protein AGOR_G00179970 [Albula goreensis]|uniref:Tetraspanin n=1 Tax=Albula goreensis TaxID=1534307 RepID=A0A8T3CZE1_9TELE|nr:hypothetical protein AGOR_G00179970 [Albula goreensis]
MAQEHSCLKRLCITFSVLYGILGILFLFVGIVAANYKNESEEFEKEAISGIIVCCVIGSFIILFAILGSFAAYKEKKLLLRVYATFLVLEAIGCFRAVPYMSSIQTEVNNDDLRQLTPLNKADGRIQKAINKMQTVAECCGLLGYEDWGDSIPQSCHCPPDYENKASKCHRVKPSSKDTLYSQQHYGNHENHEVEVYEQPCGPLILGYLEMGTKLAVGLLVTLAIIVVISAILHLLLYCHIKDQTPSTPVASGEDPKPPAYTVLHKGQAC